MKCPKCGQEHLEMSAGSGWRIEQLGFRSYRVGGKIRYKCVCGNEWEK